MKLDHLVHKVLRDRLDRKEIEVNEAREENLDYQDNLEPWDHRENEADLDHPAHRVKVASQVPKERADLLAHEDPQENEVYLDPKDSRALLVRKKFYLHF